MTSELQRNQFGNHLNHITSRLITEQVLVLVAQQMALRHLAGGKKVCNARSNALASQHGTRTVDNGLSGGDKLLVFGQLALRCNVVVIIRIGALACQRVQQYMSV